MLNVVTLGLVRLQAQATYDVLTKALQDIDAKSKQRASLPPPRSEEDKKKQEDQKAALDSEVLRIVLTLPGQDTDKAKKAAATLKSYMDATDAFTKVLGTPDSKGTTPLGRLATAQTLDQEVNRPETTVLVVKWLRAGVLNKSRKNLFFLGSRTYYGAGATALYEYYDSSQHLLKSGTVTATARYVHDKTFEKGEFNGNVRCLQQSGRKYGSREVPKDLYSCP